MPYTAAQLTAYYTSLTGLATPTASDQLVINAIATQNLQGSATDAATLTTLFHLNTVQGTFDVAESTYQFFTGATVTAAGLASLEATLNSTTGVNGTNYSLFNTENRYYNFAVNLASAGGQGNASFVATYGGLTVAQTISTAYEAIIGSSNVGAAAATAAIADINSRLAFFQSVAVSRAGGIDAGGAAGQNVALKAIIIGYILEEANKADVGTYAKALDQLAASVSAGNAIGNVNLLSVYAPGGAGYNTGVGATVTSLGQTFALGTGTDALTSTSGNATFVGLVNSTTPALSTLTAQDVINASGANNVLLVDTTGGGEASGNALLNGIQTVEVRAADGVAATFDASRTAGVNNLYSYLGSGAVTFLNVAGSTTIGDYGNGSVLTGSVTGNYISGTTESLLLQNGTNGGAITLNNTAGGATVTVTSAGAGSATTGIAGAALNTVASLNFGNTVTTLNVVANSQLTVTGATTVTGTVGTLNVSGTALTSLGGTAISVNNVRESSTGGLTANFLGTAANGAAVNIIGSTAVDNITLTGPVAATTVVNTSGSGGGTSIGDTITLTGAITAGASLNAGGGGTLGITSANYLAASAFSAANRALITGFSTVGITDALTNGSTYDINLFGATNFTTVGVASNGGNITYNAATGTLVGNAATVNTPTGALVTFIGSNGGAVPAGIGANGAALNIVEAGAVTNTTDSLTLGFVQQGTNVANNTQLEYLSATGVESVQVIANRAAGASASSLLQLSLQDAVLKSISFAGNENFQFNVDPTNNIGPFTAYAQLSSITSTSTGSANIDVQALTTQSQANPIVVTTGSGVNTVNVKDFARVTEGAANNLLNVGVVSNGNTYSSLVDAHAGDRISFTSTTAVNATKIVLAGTALFQDYLNAATAANIGNGQVSAFDFSGNTYLVENNAGGTGLGFDNGIDTVIQLVGIHTVSGTIGATVAASGSTTGSFGGVVTLTS